MSVFPDLTYIILVPIWDATALFKKNKQVEQCFMHDNFTSLPLVTRELEYGDLVMVYYSASTYANNNTKSFPSAKDVLSMNLYGAVLLCRAAL